MTLVYRAPLRARHLDVAPGVGAEFGLEHDVVGIEAGSSAKELRMAERLATLPDGTFVWTRDTRGAYWVGRIAGRTRREESPAARAVGITWVRDVRWCDRGLDEAEVPPAVVASFARGGRNMQRVHGAGVEQQTEDCWEATLVRTDLA